MVNNFSHTKNKSNILDESNAVNLYKKCHSDKELNKIIKYNYKDTLNKLKLLKKELKKYNINLYYLDNMGKWSTLYLHFIDYSWDDAINLSKLENKENESIIFTDDIYMLSGLLNGKLYFQHNILKKDIKNLKYAFKKIYNVEFNFLSKKSIIIILNKL